MHCLSKKFVSCLKKKNPTKLTIKKVTQYFIYTDVSKKAIVRRKSLEEIRLIARQLSKQLKIKKIQEQLKSKKTHFEWTKTIVSCEASLKTKIRYLQFFKPRFINSSVRVQDEVVQDIYQEYNKKFFCGHYDEKFNPDKLPSNLSIEEKMRIYYTKLFKMKMPDCFKSATNSKMHEGLYVGEFLNMAIFTYPYKNKKFNTDALKNEDSIELLDKKNLYYCEPYKHHEIIFKTDVESVIRDLKREMEGRIKNDRKKEKYITFLLTGNTKILGKEEKKKFVKLTKKIYEEIYGLDFSMDAFL